MNELENLLKENYNVISCIEAIFGEWIVTADGDVISLKHHYPIYSDQINDDKWLLHMKDKTWFDQECEMGFIQAFKKACEILNIKVKFKEKY